MATIAGKDANINVDACDNHAHAWAMDIVCEALEDTNWGWADLDRYWQSFISGLKGWTGSYEVYIDDALSDQCMPCVGEIAAATFFVDFDAGIGFQGSILITVAHPSVTIEGIQAMTYDFQGVRRLSFGSVTTT